MKRILCSICNVDDCRAVFECRDILVKDDATYSLVKCNRCGLVYVNPQPSVEKIKAVYPRDFVAYQFEVFDNDPGASFRDKAINFIVQSVNLDRIRSIAAVRPLNASTRAVDIGCGKGGFLYHLRKMYQCDVTGMDFDDDCLKFCVERLGLRMYRGNLESNPELLSGEKFDLVTMWAYLEHDPSPLETLIHSRQWLKDNGLLVVEVPNVLSLENRIFGKCSYLYDIPRHLTHFAPETLKLLLDKAGYDILKVTFPGGTGGYIGTLQRLLSGDRIYKNMKNHLFFLFSAAWLIAPLEVMLSFTSMGSNMRIFAVKQK